MKSTQKLSGSSWRTGRQNWLIRCRVTNRKDLLQLLPKNANATYPAVAAKVEVWRAVGCLHVHVFTQEDVFTLGFVLQHLYMEKETPAKKKEETMWMKNTWRRKWRFSNLMFNSVVLSHSSLYLFVVFLCNIRQTEELWSVFIWLGLTPDPTPTGSRPPLHRKCATVYADSAEPNRNKNKPPGARAERDSSVLNFYRTFIKLVVLNYLFLRIIEDRPPRHQQVRKVMWYHGAREFETFVGPGSSGVCEFKNVKLDLIFTGKKHYEHKHKRKFLKLFCICTLTANVFMLYFFN